MGLRAAMPRRTATTRRAARGACPRPRCRTRRSRRLPTRSQRRSRISARLSSTLHTPHAATKAILRHMQLPYPPTALGVTCLLEPLLHAHVPCGVPTLPHRPYGATCSSHPTAPVVPPSHRPQPYPYPYPSGTLTSTATASSTRTRSSVRWTCGIYRSMGPISTSYSPRATPTLTVPSTIMSLSTISRATPSRRRRWASAARRRAPTIRR